MGFWLGGPAGAGLGIRIGGGLGAVGDLAATGSELIKGGNAAIDGYFDRLEAPLAGSLTPEDKFGPKGYNITDSSSNSVQRYTAMAEAFSYRIDFWNKEDATAPAQEVFIVDTLDANFDDTTLKFRQTGFLRWSVELEGGHYFNVDVDMRPDFDLIVNVEGKYDQDSRELRWTFRSLDPATGKLPEDPLAGFLPPIDSTGYQIGWVSYSVKPKSGLSTGTKIKNQAFVNFDGVGPWNPAPPNPDSEIPGLGPWINTIDADLPNSKILSFIELPDTRADSSMFELHWTGSDIGSGISDYTIYVADGSGAYVPWLRNTRVTTAVYVGVPNIDYSFYSIARDNVGNREKTPAKPDVVTSISDSDGNIPKKFALYDNYPNPFNPTTTIKYDLPEATDVKLVIYNILGQRVKTLIDKKQLAGSYTVQWDGKNGTNLKVASGVYIYRIEAGKNIKARKMLLLK
ncbi:T9SS type A sorting domain-containing protein [candidate division KSB1 bacterium]|nr:T9SS type A sorting domain-containing protein [candidate division KSB1 bacterium]